MKKLLYVLISALAISCASNSQQKEKEEADRKADSIIQQAELYYEKEKAERANSMHQKDEQQKQAKKQIFEGRYYCPKTGDNFEFNSDHTGEFTPKGGYVTATFSWRKNGTRIKIRYTGESDYLGNQSLTYNKKTQQITEISESFGKLVYNKLCDY